MRSDRETPPACGYCGAASWTATRRAGRGVVRICDPCHERVWRQMRTVDVDTPTDPEAAVARYRERHGIGQGTGRTGGESLADALLARADVTEREVDRLFEAGYDTRRAIEAATASELADVDGIQPEDATRIVHAFGGTDHGTEDDDAREDDDDDEDPGLGRLFG